MIIAIERNLESDRNENVFISIAFQNRTHRIKIELVESDRTPRFRVHRKLFYFNAIEQSERFYRLQWTRGFSEELHSIFKFPLIVLRPTAVMQLLENLKILCNYSLRAL